MTPEIVRGVFTRFLAAVSSALCDPDERLPPVAQLADGEWTIDGVPILS
jgi:hypothetical protein